ncbi:hypothetical protein JW978_01750 [Candidatus Dojkabacteria bacterium]|nr:hypothetical protein [Candidatus Dojkabacteria bacterium]
MSEFVVDLIDLNEKVDYSVFVTLFCSYLATLWLVISVWVGVDAWKRYQNKNFAIMFFLLTFFLNFPILVFYFIIRPENKASDYEEWETGGVNVPVVNFLGKEGVDMVLQLKINPSKVVPDDNDMRVDVSWESNKENMQLTPTPAQKDAKETENIPVKPSLRADRKVINIFSKWRGQAKKNIEKIKEVKADYAEKGKTGKSEKTEKVSSQKKHKKIKKNKKNKKR